MNGPDDLYDDINFLRGLPLKYNMTAEDGAKVEELAHELQVMRELSEDWE